MSLRIANQIAMLGNGPLTEVAVRDHVWPLFSRALLRDEIYLSNHSLGRPLDQTARDVQEALDLWYLRMDGVWDDDAWPAEMQRFRTSISRLIGLGRSDCLVPKSSAGQGLRAVLNSFGDRKPLVVATRGEFDSVDFILKTYRDLGRIELNWIPSAGDAPPYIESQSILDSIRPGVDLLVLSAVLFMTGQVLCELPRLIKAAHDAGAKVLVDVYHAAAVIPIDMTEWDADFLIGGSYKYLRGGTGACWLAIHPRIAESGLATLDTGWFAKDAPFEYNRPESALRASGGDGWLESTPSILPFFQARAGLELVLGIGVDRLRQYSLGQLAILRQALQERGVGVHVPEAPDHFGGFALLPHSDAEGVCRRLKAQGVNVDSRLGHVRLGPDLMNSQEELEEASRRVAAVLQTLNSVA